MGTGGIARYEDRRPLKHRTPDLHGVSERPWPQREARQQQFGARSFLGEQPEVGTFYKLVKLDIKTCERHCLKIWLKKKKKVQRKDVMEILPLQPAP